MKKMVLVKGLIFFICLDKLVVIFVIGFGKFVIMYNVGLCF